MAGGDRRIWHGGDLGEAQRLFPAAPRPWIDLSTGINPVPYPLPPLAPSVFSRLPSPSEVAELERVAAAAYGAPDPRAVVAAPGTQVLIEVLPRLRTPGPVAVLAPTYAEHGHAWCKAGHAVTEVASFDGAADAGVVVVVNPNNPDGARWPAPLLRDRAARLAARGGWLVVDEAFADLEEDMASLAPARAEGAVVLRSFGKTFGLAGLRLGFAIANPELADALRCALGPWAVSGPAIAIGQSALADRAWLAQAAEARAADTRRLDGLLGETAARLVGGTRLFRLVETPQAEALFQHLGRHGIWVRRFQGRPDRLRFGLPGTPAEWHRLAAAIRVFGAHRAP